MFQKLIQEESLEQRYRHGRDADVLLLKSEWMAKLMYQTGKLLKTSGIETENTLVKIAATAEMMWDAQIRQRQLYNVEVFYKETMAQLFPQIDKIESSWKKYQSAMLREDKYPYHNYRHIADIINVYKKIGHSVMMKQFNGVAVMPVAVKLAILFHDYVYNTSVSARIPNEDASVEEMKLYLLELGAAPPGTIMMAEKLILSTRHHQPIETDVEADVLWSQCFLDLDLSILGADEDQYQQYEAAVRYEYSWVPDDEFYSARKNIMNSFAKKDKVFFLLTQLEDAAKQNLKRWQ